ncbi:MAG: class I SAM-dependent methyltransferase [Planktomarina sp.]
MTPLEVHLIERITQHGPLRLSDYMAECLMHPDHGYYTQEQVFGRTGDFVTAPGISQMFGEMVGLSLAQSWITQGRPKDAILVELGPGHGTLMADIRRVAKAVPGFDALDIHMVEQSPKLRTIQTQANGVVTHHNDVSQLPDRPMFITANEFFDALPIRQFRRTDAAWQECLIGVVDEKLAYGVSAPQQFDFLQHRLADTKPDDLVEYCPALPDIMTHLSTKIAQHGGAALMFDYGDWRSQGDTLQAVQDHKPVPPLTAPGTIDLTAHVDFEAIYNAAPPAVASKLTTQGVFLERLGITQRAQVLAQKLSGDALENHITAHRRLTHPDEMGTLFKVMGLAPTLELMPPGVAV